MLKKGLFSLPMQPSESQLGPHFYIEKGLFGPLFSRISSCSVPKQFVDQSLISVFLKGVFSSPKCVDLPSPKTNQHPSCFQSGQDCGPGPASSYICKSLLMKYAWTRVGTRCISGLYLMVCSFKKMYFKMFGHS